MRFSDVVGLARGNLSRAPLRTALTAVGVAIGTAAVVTLVSLGNGSEAIFVNRARSFGQLTTVAVAPSTPRSRSNSGQFHALTPATVNAITRLPHVDEVDRFVALPPLRLTVNGRSADLGAVGQAPLTAGVTVTVLAHAAALAPDGVLVPDTMAHKLGLSPSALAGRRVTLTAGGSVCCGSSADSSTVVLGPDRHFSAHVAGVYADNTWSFGGDFVKSDGSAWPLLLATSLAGTIEGQLRGMSGAAYLARQGYAVLYVHTDDARQTSAVAGKISALQYQVFDRSNLLDEVHTVFTILTAGLGTIGGIALLVAAIGIANTLIMTILERTREIGIMKALGAEPGMIRRLFLVETALVGLLGGIAGLVIAALVGVVGNTVFHIWLKRQGVTAAIGNLFVLSIELAVGALALAVVVSLLAGAWPSRRAVRLQPLDALRYE